MFYSNKIKDIKPSSTLEITAKAKQMKADGYDVVGFGAGEPDFDTPAHIKDAAIEAIKNGFTKYTPASGTNELKEAICKKLKEENNLEYNTNQIIISNGAKHSLTNAFMAILNPKDEVIVPAPYWLSYVEMIKIADGVPVIVKTTKENNYKITVNELEKSLTSKTKALIINSPSNPTGMLYSKEELEAIAKFVVDNDLLVISDEIYEKLIYDNKKHISIASLNEEIYNRTIVINGVSKSYSMTGWRIGYTAAKSEIIKMMSNMQSHCTSNPNSIAQKAAIAAITGSQQCVEEMKIEFNKRRNYMVERIQNIKEISCIPPQGAFYIFIDLDQLIGKLYKENKINSANDFAKLLLDEKNVAVVPCRDFGFENHIRLSYAISLEQITKGLDRIESFIKEIK